jgi:senataxin
MFELL